MDKYYENKVAVVTGAAGTLCSVIAEDLADKGAKVVLVDMNVEKLNALCEKITAKGGFAIVRPCDITNEEAVQALADDIYKELGPVSFLLNGAGGNNINAMTTNNQYDERELTPEKPEDMRCFFDLKMENVKNVLVLNTMGTIIPTRVFAKHMIELKNGAVLNFASMNTYRPLSRVPAYAMSKAAVANLTQWLAYYFAPAGIRVNAVAPGFFVNERSINYLGTVETGLTARGQNVINHTAMGRFGEAKDLLGTVNFLLDDRMASFVTGITVPCDGGFLTSAGL